MVSFSDGSGDRELERRDELLSAYVDGELSDEEHRALEARLSRDSELRAELRAMERTVSLMRALPEVEAPRNFILTPSMAGQHAAEQRTETRLRRPIWVAPLLTLATTVVSLLFAVVLVGDLVLPGIGGMASAPAPMREADEAPAVALEAAPTEERQAERSLPTPMPSAPPPPSPEAEEKELVEEPEMAMEMEEEAAATEAMRATRAPAGAGALPPPTAGDAVTEEVGALSAPTPTPTLPPLPTNTPASPDLTVPTVAPTVAPAAVLTPTIPPEEPVISEDELGLLEPTPGELETTPALPEEGLGVTEAREPGRVPLRVLEVGLGLSSLILLIVTIQVWRRR